LNAWEKLRRAVARLLVAETAAQDLLLRAKHLVFPAMLMADPTDDAIAPSAHRMRAISWLGD
jgi:hypothetical protein